MIGESFSATFSSPAAGTLIGLADAVAIAVLFSKVSALESRFEQHAERRSSGALSGSSDHLRIKAFAEGSPTTEAQDTPLEPMLKDVFSRVSALERGFASTMKRTDDLQKAVLLLAHHMKELSATSISSRSLGTFPTQPIRSPTTAAQGVRVNTPISEEQSLLELGW